MGVSVSSRHFKRAVDRNLLKRRIRESYRKQKLALKTSLEEKGLVMDLFLVYIEPKILSYQEIDTAITEALTKLIRRTASKMGA
jgi:ribonuclease P protein component